MVTESNAALATADADIDVLQWGRDLMVTEREERDVRMGPDGIVLQWGRDLMVTESA